MAKRIDKAPTETVLAMSKINFEGNIHPEAWYQTLPFNGKSDLVAVTLLAEIVYWYRPVLIRDEHTGKIVSYKKKFSGDKLQRSIRSFVNQFGLSIQQVRDGLNRLRENGLIETELRNITTESGIKLSNVQYIDLNVDRLIEVTFPADTVLDPNPLINKDEDFNGDVRKNSRSVNLPLSSTDETLCSPDQTPCSPEQTPCSPEQTYTETSTKNTTEIISEGEGARGRDVSDNISGVEQNSPAEINTPFNRGKKQMPEIPFPATFIITPAMYEWAAVNVPAVDLTAETGKLQDWALDKGRTSKDWVARWRRWMRIAQEDINYIREQKEKTRQPQATRKPGLTIRN